MKPLRSTACEVVLALILFTLALGPAGCSDCDLEIVTNALPDASAGVPYAFRVVSDCGGDFWFVAEGNLPPGVGLLDNGVLRGTPTAAGMFSFTLGVFDVGTGERAFKGFTLNVLEGS